MCSCSKCRVSRGVGIHGADSGACSTESKAYRETEVWCQSLVLMGDMRWWPCLVFSGCPHEPGASPSWAPGSCHPACLFSVKCGQTQGPRHAPSLLEAARAPSPCLSSFLSSFICIFLYLLQRSEKQINEKWTQ